MELSEGLAHLSSVTLMVQTPPPLVTTSGVVLYASLHLFAVFIREAPFYVIQRTSQNKIISVGLYYGSVRFRSRKVNIGTFLTFKLFIVYMFTLSCCKDLQHQGNITQMWSIWLIREVHLAECNEVFN